MPVTFAHRTISHVAVIGSGQIGPDIALHFAKVLEGVRVTVVDVSEAALAAGKARTWKKLDKGAETGAFKPAQVEAMKAALTFTSDYSAIAGAELVVEAATEDEALKGRIFAQVEKLVAPHAILLSNSSHLEPERIFATLADKTRAAVAHYFFPAERNLVVDIVSGEDTAPEIAAWLMLFYEVIGKLPITRIMFTHRLGTLKNCDRIVLLDQGCVAQQGNFDELMQQSEFFKVLSNPEAG